EELREIRFEAADAFGEERRIDGVDGCVKLALDRLEVAASADDDRKRRSRMLREGDVGEGDRHVVHAAAPDRADDADDRHDRSLFSGFAKLQEFAHWIPAGPEVAREFLV